MRRRLVVLLVLLMGGILAALSVPFGRSLAASRSQEVFVDRLSDTTGFAATAQQAIGDVSLETLSGDLARYSELYGITAAVFGIGGTAWAVSGPREKLDSDEVRHRFRQAVDGHQSAAPPTIWPWTRADVVVAVPVMRGDNVVAVALTVSSTQRLRAQIARELGLLLLADLAAMVLLAALATRLANWVLGPVFVLDAAARAISSGDLTVRVGATGPGELRRLANTFNSMASAVDLAMQRQEEFVADASHQLRNPLAALVLRLDALAMGLDDASREQLRFAREEAGRLGAILDELLELATAVHVSAQPVVVDVAVLVAARIDAWQPMAARARVRLLGPPGDALGSALADPVLISSALDAVLDNALKFTPAQGRVVVSLVDDGDAIVVEVVDDGPGLSPEELAHIGDRFWRGAATQEIPGSGLGLSIARTLLRTTGAEIAFAAASPNGLRVSIRLPRAGRGAPAHPTSSAQAAVPPSAQAAVPPRTSAVLEAGAR